MSRCIDADKLKKHFEWWEGEAKAKEFKEIFDEIIDAQPTADPAEILTNELTKEISERLILFLEENYEIIPKNPAVRCKDCKWFNDSGCAIRIVDESDKPKEGDFCAWGERKEE